MRLDDELIKIGTLKPVNGDDYELQPSDESDSADAYHCRRRIIERPVETKQ